MKKLFATGNDVPDPNKPKPQDSDDPAPEVKVFAPKGKQSLRSGG
jgi:hypothetical protein